ncbi:MAG: hypothetical protein AAFR81_21685 [Chloroflexota bacterium]
MTFNIRLCWLLIVFFIAIGVSSQEATEPADTLFYSDSAPFSFSSITPPDVELSFLYPATWSTPIYYDTAPAETLKSVIVDYPLQLNDPTAPTYDYIIYYDENADVYGLMLITEDDDVLWVTETDDPVAMSQLDSGDLPPDFEGYEQLDMTQNNRLRLINRDFGANDQLSLAGLDAIGTTYSFEYDFELDAIYDPLNDITHFAEESGLYGAYIDPTERSTFQPSYTYTFMRRTRHYIEFTNPPNLADIDLRTNPDTEAVVIRIGTMEIAPNIDSETGLPRFYATLPDCCVAFDLNVQTTIIAAPNPAYIFDYSYDGGTVGIPQACRFEHRYYAPLDEILDYYIEYNICALNAESLEDYEDDLATILDSLMIDLPSR